MTLDEKIAAARSNTNKVAKAPTAPTVAPTAPASTTAPMAAYSPSVNDKVAQARAQMASTPTVRTPTARTPIIDPNINRLRAMALGNRAANNGYDMMKSATPGAVSDVASGSGHAGSFGTPEIRDVTPYKSESAQKLDALEAQRRDIESKMKNPPLYDANGRMLSPDEREAIADSYQSEYQKLSDEISSMVGTVGGENTEGAFGNLFAAERENLLLIAEWKTNIGSQGRARAWYKANNTNQAQMQRLEKNTKARLGANYKAAYDYAVMMANKENTDSMTQRNADYLTNAGLVPNALAWAGAVGTAPTRGAGAVSAVGNTASNLLSSATGNYKNIRPLDTNSDAFKTTNMANAIQAGNRGAIVKYESESNSSFAKWLSSPSAITIFGKNLSNGQDRGQFIYGIITSAAESSVNALVSSGVTNVTGLPTDKVMNYVMGSSAASQAILENKAKGMSDSDAVLSGVISGAIEGITETWSVENILTATGPIYARLLKSFASEAEEEMAADALNWLADYVLHGNQSEISTRLREKKESGMSDEDALKSLVSELAGEAIASGYAGGLSGMLMGGADAAARAGGIEVGNVITGKDINDEGTTKALVDEAKATGDAKLTQRAADVEQKASPRSVGKLAEETRNVQLKQRAEAVTEAKGITDTKTAEALYKQMRGEELTSAEEKRIETLNKAEYVSEEQKAQPTTEQSETTQESPRTVQQEKNYQTVMENAFGEDWAKTAPKDARQAVSKMMNDVISQSVVKSSAARAMARNYKLINAIEKSTGTKVVVEDFGNNFIGFFEDGKIHINSKAIESDATRSVLVHEFVHKMRSSNENSYKPMLEYVKAQYTADGWERQLADLDTAYKEAKNQNLSRDGLEEEAVADFMGDMLADSKNLNRIINKGDRNFIQRAYNWVRDILSSVGNTLTGKNKNELVEAEKAFEKALKSMPKEETEVKEEQKSVDDEQITRNAIDQIAESMDMSFDRDEDGNWYLKDSRGRKYTSATPKATLERVIANSSIGKTMDIAVRGVGGKYQNMTNTDKQKVVGFFADLTNLILSTQDIDLVYAVSAAGFEPYSKTIEGGEERRGRNREKNVFSGLTSNSDPQYSSTIDFTTICLKTKAIVDVMSDVMTKRGKGLSKQEITDIVYKEVYDAGQPVPCPVCYVFSRWVGAGELLDNMNNLQKEYGKDADIETVKKAFDALESQVKEIAKKPKYDSKDREKLQKVLNKRFAILDGKNTAYELGTGEALTAEEKSEYEELKQDIRIMDNWTWFKDVRFNKNYKDIDTDVLFDLNASERFKTEFPLQWKFRTTRGSAMGKAITSYAAYHHGEFIMGRSFKKFDAKNAATRLSNEKNVFIRNEQRTEKDQASRAKTAVNKYKAACENVKALNLIGGQRWQSTSDFRFEYALDYLLAAADQQMVGSKVQLYTKVPEAVRFFASIGCEVNLSLMPDGKGWEYNKDGNLVLKFSRVSGMDEREAFTLSKMYPSVQPIMVGVNRTHILACMADDRITFIIPYHSSGASERQYASLMAGIRENVNPEDRDDYTPYQNDNERKDGTKEQKATWKAARSARMKILKGEGRTLNLQEKQAVKDVYILGELYKRFYGTDVDGNEVDGVNVKIDERYRIPGEEGSLDSQCYGVKLGKDQAEHIFPYEYWNTQSTYETADENGRAFVEYCEALGIHPRFSGYNSDGKYNADYDFTKESGYWKTLIDRSMYNHTDIDGNVDNAYHNPTAINVGDLNTDALVRDKAVDNLSYKESASKQNDPRAVPDISSKVIDKLDGRKNSLAQLDSDYMELASDPVGREYKLRGIVDKAAKEAGYTLHLYHGSNNLGFTKIDTSKSDDGISFFTTDSKKTARSYAYGNDVVKIKDTGYKDITPFSSDKDILEGLRKGAPEAHIATEEELTDKLYSSWLSAEVAAEDLANSNIGSEAFREMMRDFASVAEDDTSGGIELYRKWNSKQLALVREALENVPESREYDVRQIRRFFDDCDTYLTETSFVGEYGVISKEEAVSDARSLYNFTRNGSGLYELYVNPDNFYSLDCKNSDWNEIELPKEIADSIGRETATTREVAKWAKDNGYDGVEFRRVFDIGAEAVGDESPSDVYAVFPESNNVKSADLVTYDDNGDIIPLSERFNSQNDDIRYSLAQIGDESQQEAVARYSEIAKTIENLNKVYGTMPGGEQLTDIGNNPITKNVDLPAATEDGKTRRFYQTAAESHHTDEQMVNDIMEDVVTNTYTPESDRASVTRANKRFEETGYERSIGAVDTIFRGDNATRDDVVYMQRVLVEAANRKDYDTFREVLSKLAIVGTQSGQVVQAFSLLKRMGNDGQLLTVQRTVEKLNQQLEKKNERKRNENSAEITTTQAEIDELQKKISENEELVEKYNKKESELNQKLDDARERNAKLTEDVETLKQSLADARKALSKENAKHKALLKHIERVEAKLDAVSGKLTESYNGTTVLTEIAMETQNLLKDVLKVRRDVNAIQRKINSKYNAAEKRIEQRIEAMDVLEKELRSHLLTENFRVGKEAEDLQIKIDGLRERIAELGEIVNDSKATDNAKAAALISMEKFQSQLDEAEAQYAELPTLADKQRELDTQKKALEELKNKMRTLDGSIVLSKESIEAIREAKTQKELETAVENAYAEIGRQMPATWADKWNALRYMGMLCNPTTHIRNIIGNAAFIPARRVQNVIRHGLERAFGEQLGAELMTARLTKEDAPLKQIAGESFAENKKVLQSSGKYNPSNAIRENQTIFNSKFLEAIRKKNGDLLEAEDLKFIQFAYVDAYAQYLKANNYSEADEQRQAQLRGRAVEVAANEAWKATYRDASKLAEAIQKFADTNAVTKVLVEGALPFKKTPINIAKRGFEYSPLGLASGIVQMASAVKGGKYSAAQALDSLASGLTGTGIFALGMLLASMGILTGSKDDDKDKDKATKYKKNVTGFQTYALRIGGDTYTIDWLAPTALPMFSGVEAYRLMKGSGVSITNMTEALGNTLSPMVEMSMLSSVADLVENYGGGDSEGVILTNKMMDLTISYLTQPFPTFGGKINNIIDGRRRLVYYNDKSSNMPRILQIPTRKLAAKIPFASYLNPIEYDMWGREVRDGFGERVIESMVSPGYYSHKNLTKIDNEIIRLYNGGAGAEVLPAVKPSTYYQVQGETYNMSAKEYSRFAKIKGATQYDLVSKLVSDSRYKKLDDADKAKLIVDMYDYASYTAKVQVTPDYTDTSFKKREECCKGAGISYVDFMFVKRAAGTNKKDIVAYLDRSPYNWVQKGYLFNALATKGTNNPYRNNEKTS